MFSWFVQFVIISGFVFSCVMLSIVVRFIVLFSCIVLVLCGNSLSLSPKFLRWLVVGFGAVLFFIIIVYVRYSLYGL